MSQFPECPEPPRSNVQIARDMLIRCRDQYQFYGDQHAAKSPPQLEKAAVNYKFVAEINAALLDIAPRFSIPANVTLRDEEG